MDSRWTACRVCRAPKLPMDLDRTGRCKNCTDAKTATDMGTTYGKLIGARHEAKQADAILQARLETELLAGLERQKRERAEKGLADWEKVCPICGTIFRFQRQSRIFCSKECSHAAAYEKRRGKEEAKKCRCCGKELPAGKRIYCSKYCQLTEEDRKRKESRKKA